MQACAPNPVTMAMTKMIRPLLQMSHDLIVQTNIKTEARQTMTSNNAKGAATLLGIDLAKQSFQLHGVDKNGQIVLKKKLSRKQLTAFIARPHLFNRP